MGLYSALINDVVGYLVYFWIHGYTSGPFYLGFTINSILYGVLPGIIYSLKIKDFKLFRFINFSFLVLMFGLGVWGLFNINQIIALIEGRLGEGVNFSPWVIYFMLIIGELGIISIFYFVVKNRNEDDKAHRMIFTVIILQVLVTLVLTPIWVSNLYGIPFWPQLPLRIVKTPIEIFIYSILLIRIVKSLNSYLFADIKKESNL